MSLARNIQVNWNFPPFDHQMLTFDWNTGQLALVPVSVNINNVLRFSWELQSQDIPANSSRINWWLQVTTTIQSQASMANIPVQNTRFTININGQPVVNNQARNFTLAHNRTTTILSGQATIPHTGSGAQNFNFSFNLTGSTTQAGNNCLLFFGDTRVNVPNAQGSGSGSLPAIDRNSAMRLSANTVPFVQPVTIDITSPDPAFVHDLTFRHSGGQLTFASNVATSFTWSPPQSLAAQIPNSISLAGVIICDVWTGSPRRWVSQSQQPFTVTVPPGWTPTIMNVGISDAAGFQGTYGSLIQGHSRLQVNWSAATLTNSPIRSQSAAIDGQGERNGPPATSEALMNTGTRSFTITATDGRGQTSTHTGSFSVTPYARPFVTGTATRTGPTTATVVFTGTTTALPNNAREFRIQWRVLGSGAWNTQPLPSGSNLTNHTQNFTGLNANSSFEFSLEARDTISGWVTVTRTIPTDFVLMDFHSSGRGIGIGKVAEAANVVDFNETMRVMVNGCRVNNVTRENLGADLNALIRTGSFWITNQANRPPGVTSMGWLEVLNTDNVRVYQRFIAEIGTGRAEFGFWTRFSGNGTSWTPWIFHQGISGPTLALETKVPLALPTESGFTGEVTYAVVSGIVYLRIHDVECPAVTSRTNACIAYLPEGGRPAVPISFKVYTDSGIMAKCVVDPSGSLCLFANTAVEHGDLIAGTGSYPIFDGPPVPPPVPFVIGEAAIGSGIIGGGGTSPGPLVIGTTAIGDGVIS